MSDKDAIDVFIKEIQKGTLISKARVLNYEKKIDNSILKTMDFWGKFKNARSSKNLDRFIDAIDNLLFTIEDYDNYIRLGD